MHQKRNSVAWRFVALLSVLSLGISLFAMSSMPTYAAGRLESLKILRPDYSEVVSVLVKAKTDAGLQIPKCIRLPAQNVLVDTGFDFIGAKDSIQIESFPNASCTIGSGIPVDVHTFNGVVLSLPYCIGGGSAIGDPACKVFWTPYQA